MSDLTHLDAEGRARMVDVGHKPPMHRTAVATGTLVAAAATLDRLVAGDLPKGDALTTAKLAGIMAAKRTSDLIPLCHPLPLTVVEVEVTVSFLIPNSERLLVIPTYGTAENCLVH